MPFIYCLDEEAKNNLIAKGYKLLKQESLRNQIVWIFEYRAEIKFDLIDKSKYFLTNKLNF